MQLVDRKFSKLGAEYAPGQEARQNTDELVVSSKVYSGIPVDFSHGDVDAFEPIPGSLEFFNKGVHIGGKQAYTEYRGSKEIREELATKLSNFIGSEINAVDNLIITPGTQGALFLAMGSTISRGDKVAIVEPDYFANRKLVEFFEGEIVPIQLDFFESDEKAGLNLSQLEEAFKAGVKLFLFSNPNNPTGVVYSEEEIFKIANLAEEYEATLIVDELYSRQIFDNRTYTHLYAQKIVSSENLITIMGPSKTESLSGYRLGVAFGSTKIIDRMEKLQAIVSLRAAGYSQSVLKSWFSEPEGWMEDRISKHQLIRDDLIAKLQAADGFKVRATEAGSYLFPEIPELKISIHEFVKALRVQAGVTVTPGTEFGPQYVNNFRINFSQDHQAAVAAMERIIQVVEEYRK
ncbi:pyridoxal phosphate-dependent aminotransferase [Solibacillus sp. MA9]|uniref:Pyridoxal phosphate-dependent aminotransferase n=1 Tax=Solibacillus palustris TaxID=2908203 RepID=A0ABS9UGF5_9BACL|nr:pyridoxal phosphate-dependent aminotransferase [Solibacillus sp. MA9]MCH7323169.1 pyridoxal phosphate-dependent aminotransferase [Solibacillus sp. MA9]